MLKSIFGKQFSAFAVSLIIAFLALGLVLSNLLEGYFFDRQITQLAERGAAVSQSYIEYVYSEMLLEAVNRGVEIRPDIYVFSPAAITQAQAQLSRAVANLSNDLMVLNQYFGASSFMVDTNMRVLATTDDITTLIGGQILENAELARVLYGEKIFATGTIGGILNERVLTVGYPIVLSNGALLGAIFMNVPMTEIEQTISDVVLLMLICLLAALAFSFVIAFFVSRSISRPIRQISDAALVISNGNFDKRIAIKSGGEVGRLAESFNYMAESLDNHERTRREFIANISHDLRSPLTSMRGFLTAIIDGTIPQSERERYIGIILDETDRLTKLTNNILEVNKFVEGGVRLDRVVFDINELITEVLFTFETKINERNISIDIEHDGTCLVIADIQAIRRVIINLVDNAVKFTENKILLKTKISGSKALISIKDNGCGINEHDQKRVFNRFYKADASRGEDRAGSGLGLAIAWEFIKAHDESIRIHSTPNHGCEIVFTLPRSKG